MTIAGPGERHRWEAGAAKRIGNWPFDAAEIADYGGRGPFHGANSIEPSCQPSGKSPAMYRMG